MFFRNFLPVLKLLMFFYDFLPVLSRNYSRFFTTFCLFKTTHVFSRLFANPFSKLLLFFYHLLPVFLIFSCFFASFCLFYKLLTFFYSFLPSFKKTTHVFLRLFACFVHKQLTLFCVFLPAILIYSYFFTTFCHFEM